MDLEQFDKQVEEIRRVWAELPPEATVTIAQASGDNLASLHVSLPLDDSASGVVAALCGLFGTPTVTRYNLAFDAGPSITVQAYGRTHRFTSIPTSAQFVMPEDAA